MKLHPFGKGTLLAMASALGWLGLLPAAGRAGPGLHRARPGPGDGRRARRLRRHGLAVCARSSSSRPLYAPAVVGSPRPTVATAWLRRWWLQRRGERDGDEPTEHRRHRRGHPPRAGRRGRPAARQRGDSSDTGSPGGAAWRVHRAAPPHPTWSLRRAAPRRRPTARGSAPGSSPTSRPRPAGSTRSPTSSSRSADRSTSSTSTTPPRTSRRRPTPRPSGQGKTLMISWSGDDTRVITVRPRRRDHPCSGPRASRRSVRRSCCAGGSR